jgi:predicted enzyme related to lactoylglutathione lyase
MPDQVPPMQLALVLDCVDARRLGEFWIAALGYHHGTTWHPPYLGMTSSDGRLPDLLLQEVPEPRRGKNRMHLDLRVIEMAPEVERLCGLGARLLHGPADDNGWLTSVLADPEGNEFCVLVPPAGPYRDAVGGAGLS